MSEYQDMEVTKHTDCLVLEVYSDAANKVFILYDLYEKSFFITGLNNFQNLFTFRCKHLRDIRNFIEFVFNYSSDITLLIHNYIDLPYNCDEISFENMDDLYETNLYSGNTLVSKTFKNDCIFYSHLEEQLNVIKNLYNKY